MYKYSQTFVHMVSVGINNKNVRQSGTRQKEIVRYKNTSLGNRRNPSRCDLIRESDYLTRSGRKGSFGSTNFSRNSSTCIAITIQACDTKRIRVRIFKNASVIRFTFEKKKQFIAPYTNYRISCDHQF